MQKNLTYQSSSGYRLSIQCSSQCNKEKSVFKMLRNTITWQFQVGLTSADPQVNSPSSLLDMVRTLCCHAQLGSVSRALNNLHTI